MQQWSEIRRRVLTGELSKRADCQEYDIHWATLQKILTHAEPPGYRRLGLPVTTSWMESLVMEMNYHIKGTKMFWYDPAAPKPSSSSAPQP